MQVGEWRFSLKFIAPDPPHGRSDVSEQFNDTLRLGELQCRSLIMRLNEDKSESERAIRHDYFERKRLVVELDPVGTPGRIAFLMKPWDLAAFEIRFLHGTFVHEDTRAIVILMAADDERVRAPGKVSRCRHIEGRVHEVVVQFDDPIEPENFSSSSQQAA